MNKRSGPGFLGGSVTALVASWCTIISTGCASAFPASALDGGRGAAALEPGASRIQVGGGGGAAPLSLAAGGGAGARYEVQWLDDLALSADVGAGLQTVTFYPSVAPVSTYLGAQYNPAGLQWLALRLRVGGGVDLPAGAMIASALGSAEAPSVVTGFEPYLAAMFQPVVSFDLDDGITMYGAPGVGVKQFMLPLNVEDADFNMADSSREACTLNICAVVDTILFPSITGGLSANMNAQMSAYVSATLTPSVLFGRTGAVKSLVGSNTPLGGTLLFSPSGNLQAGLAFVF
jgi:hypothetical protein